MARKGAADNPRGPPKKTRDIWPQKDCFWGRGTEKKVIIYYLILRKETYLYWQGKGCEGCGRQAERPSKKNREFWAVFEAGAQKNDCF